MQKVDLLVVVFKDSFQFNNLSRQSSISSLTTGVPEYKVNVSLRGAALAHALTARARTRAVPRNRCPE
jgi:hypothetical protein